MLELLLFFFQILGPHFAFRTGPRIPGDGPGHISNVTAEAKETRFRHTPERDCLYCNGTPGISPRPEKTLTPTSASISQVKHNGIVFRWNLIRHSGHNQA